MGCAGMERIKIKNDKGTVARIPDSRPIYGIHRSDFTIRKMQLPLLTQEKAWQKINFFEVKQISLRA